MTAQDRDRILRLLDAHRIMSLATLRPDGWPQATTVGYVSEGLYLYFMCGRDSQKAKNLAADDRVSATIDRDTDNPMAITGLSLAGHAEPVRDQALVRRAMLDLLPKKYPEYRGMMDRVNFDEVAVFRVRPIVFSILDYTNGFGHTDLVAVKEAELA